MDTKEKTTTNVLEHLASGMPLDPDTRRRLQERGEEISEVLRKTYGQMDIAVELIREARDES